MQKVGVIINPNARGVKKMKVSPLEHFRAIAGEAGDVRLTNSVEEIDPVIKDFKKQKIPYIAVCGGDGTYHHIISRVIELYKKTPKPSFLHLRAGTMNTAPRTIHLKGKPPQLLKRISLALQNGGEIKTHTRDTIRVNNMYGMIFGIGMSANFLNEYYKGEGTGPKEAVKVILKAVRGVVFKSDVGTLFDRVKARILIDGRELPHNDFLAVLAATVSDVGIGFEPLYRAYEKEGTFHVLSVGTQQKEIVKNIWKIRTGKPIKHPLVFDNLAKKLEIISDDRLLYTIDGDMYEAEGKLVAEAGPQVNLVYV